MTINVTLVQSSSYKGQRIDTFELEYPRFIHAELMTHRLFSRNAASSRAIPVKKALDLIRNNTAMPEHWGKNQKGMQADTEISDSVVITKNGSRKVLPPQEAWKIAAESSSEFAQAFDNAGYHKQLVNRITEPFSHIKVVVTATEFDNWFWLRAHPDAQPEIRILAEKMKEAYDEADTFELKPGEYHVPYIVRLRSLGGEILYYTTKDKVDDNGESFVRLHPVKKEDALKISSSCCAQVSYRVNDGSIEKARDIYNRLVEAEPIHASPFEHQATPVSWYMKLPLIWKYVIGLTHKDRYGKVWSGNFKGWIQYRQVLMYEMKLEAMTSKKV